MIIISDERNIETTGKCEECHEVTIVRPVKAVGVFRESRGYYKLCLSCFGSRIFWKKSENGRVYTSPAEGPKKD